MLLTDICSCLCPQQSIIRECLCQSNGGAIRWTSNSGETIRFSYWLRRIGPTLYPLKDTLKWWFTHLDTICFVFLEKVFNGIHVVLHVLCELFGLYTTAVNQWLPGTRFELVMTMQTASLPYVTDSINNLWTTQSNSIQQVKGVRFSGLWDHLFAPCWFITIQFYLYSTHNRCLKTPYSVRYTKNKKIREFTKVSDMQYKDAGSEKRGKKMMKKRQHLKALAAIVMNSL